MKVHRYIPPLSSLDASRLLKMKVNWMLVTLCIIWTGSVGFVLFGTSQSDRKSNVYYAGIKCLPVVTMMLFVVLHGMTFSEYYRYTRRIFLALLFSVIGDAALVWADKYFELGLCMFALAHVAYTVAFGWKPLRLLLGVCLAPISSVSYVLILPGLRGELVYLTAIYLFIILLMVWRGTARIVYCEDLRTWPLLCTFLGSILFAISDCILGFNKFRIFIPHSHMFIMSTYYASQLFLSFSVMDHPREATHINSKTKKDQWVGFIQLETFILNDGMFEKVL